MKITILNGSPRKENTAAMVEAFAEGAKAAGLWAALKKGFVGVSQ